VAGRECGWTVDCRETWGQPACFQQVLSVDKHRENLVQQASIQRQTETVGQEQHDGQIQLLHGNLPKVCLVHGLICFANCCI